MAPENHYDSDTGHSSAIASMRPGLDGPGKLLSDRYHWSGEQASMRPGLDGPGKREVLLLNSRSYH